MSILFRTSVNKDDYVIATYELASATTLDKACLNLAIGQSVGNPNIRNKWETDELFENHSCKILGDQSVMNMMTSGTVEIAFPVVNTDWKHDGISHLLVQLMGGQSDIDDITRCRLIKLEIPDHIVRTYFLGPKYGLQGVRDFTKVYNKPLLGGIVKPKIGITPEVLLELVKEMVEGGVNFIKEDEIMGNPDVCPIEKRVPLISEYIKGKNVIYAVCINGDAPHVLDRVKRVYELGGNAVHVNFWCGLGIYKSIREMDLPLFVHFQRSGIKILTDPSHRYSIDWSVICQLAAMSGIDTIHVGMLNGYSCSDRSELDRVFEVLYKYGAVPALSCGMHPGVVNSITSQIGNNYLANVGGALHGHDGGTVAGVRAMRQAIDHDFDQPEYKSAIKKWGLVE